MTPPLPGKKASFQYIGLKNSYAYLKVKLDYFHKNYLELASISYLLLSVGFYIP